MNLGTTKLSDAYLKELAKICFEGGVDKVFLELKKYEELFYEVSQELIRRNNELEKCYAEIADKEKIISEIGTRFQNLFYGTEGKYGIFDMMDSYYNGCCDEEVSEIEKLL